MNSVESLNTELHEVQVLDGTVLLTIRVTTEEMLQIHDEIGGQQYLQQYVQRERERTMCVLDNDSSEAETNNMKDTQEIDSDVVNNNCTQETDNDDDCAADSSNSFIWNDKIVYLFLELYREKQPQFKSKRAKLVFDDIAQEMFKVDPSYKVSGKQCSTKLAGLKRTYRNIKDSNSKTGNIACSWAFFSVMDDIFGEKASTVPPSIAGNDVSNSSVSSPPSQKRQADPVVAVKPKQRRVETLLAGFISSLDKKREEEREEMEKLREKKEQQQKTRDEEKKKFNREKIEVQKQMVDLLAQLINNRK